MKSYGLLFQCGSVNARGAASRIWWSPDATQQLVASWRQLPEILQGLWQVSGTYAGSLHTLAPHLYTLLTVDRLMRRDFTIASCKLRQLTRSAAAASPWI